MFGIASLATIVLSVIMLIKLSRANSEVPFSRKMIYFTILWLFSYSIGFGIEKGLSLLFKAMQILTMHYFMIGIIVVLITISYFATIYLANRKKLPE